MAEVESYNEKNFRETMKFFRFIIVSIIIVILSFSAFEIINLFLIKEVDFKGKNGDFHIKFIIPKEENFVIVYYESGQGKKKICLLNKNDYYYNGGNNCSID